MKVRSPIQHYLHCFPYLPIIILYLQLPSQTLPLSPPHCSYPPRLMPILSVPPQPCAYTLPTWGLTLSPLSLHSLILLQGPYSSPSLVSTAT